MKPILIVMTSHPRNGDSGVPTGFYLSEVTHPLAVFEREGVPVAFASIKGGSPPVDGLDLEDPLNARYWSDHDFRARIATTARLADLDPANYSAIFFAGGHGAVWDFPSEPAVNDQTRAIWEQGGIVSAVCHGPAALTNVTLSDGNPLVRGRRVAAFTDAEETAIGLQNVVPFLLSSKLAGMGALMQPGPDWTSQVVADGRLVTGQNPQSATAVAEEIVKLLKV